MQWLTIVFMFNTYLRDKVSILQEEIECSSHMGIIVTGRSKIQYYIILGNDRRIAYDRFSKFASCKTVRAGMFSLKSD